ncbi:hypothetical protein ACH5RR_028358, partial [Cinchona calisaya]
DPIIILWNPSIKKSVFLPKPNVTLSSHGEYFHSIAFGFDRVSNDYKLVRIVEVEDTWLVPLVELFKLSTGECEDISHVAIPCHIYMRCSNACINGALHWLGPCECGDEVILLYDLSNDVFEVITLPDCVLKEGHPLQESDPDLVTKMVDIYEGSVALVVYDQDSSDHNFCLWIMKRYGFVDSWTMIIRNLKIKVLELDAPSSSVKWLSRYDFFTGLSDYDSFVDGLALFGRGEQLGYRGSRAGQWNSFYEDSFIQSLVLLDRRGCSVL